MDIGATNRGFARGEFSDANGIACSIQESSADMRGRLALAWV